MLPLGALMWLLADADSAVLHLMPGEPPRVMHRAHANAELDVVVALSNRGDWWDQRTKLGVFLHRRDNPGVVYKIAIENGSGDADCFARVERATATDVVISCTPEKGAPGPNRKFVYDVRAKVLVKRVDYDPFAMYRMFVSGQKAVLVGSDRRRLVALEYISGQAPPFRLLKGAQAEAWTRRVAVTTGTVGAGPGQRSEIYVQPERPKPLPFPLPRTTYEEFSRARPARVKDGYSREATEIVEQIGPQQSVDGKVWFGKTFYDGEGTTGVGGFGYFDPNTRKYQIYSPEEIRDWSVSAMLVESDAVWLGLAHNGEWGSSGGGILRFDRTTEKVTRLELHEIVGAIARAGDYLVMATGAGPALFDGSHLRRFFVDETTDGRLRVVEAVR